MYRMGKVEWRRRAMEMHDEIRSLKGILTAKDAEIERLQGVLREIADQDPVEAALAPDWAILRAKAALTTETHERGDVGRQDRRSGASAHGEPSDTPTGDTR